MASEEHLKILKHGVDAWNEWRKQNRSSEPDLDGINLSDADLIGADLYHAHLNDCDPKGTHLVGANLSYAYLTHANLTGADLRYADLTGADLTHAYLHRANLSDANLRSAELCGSHLNSAVLRNVELRSTMLASANLIETDLFGANFSAAILSETVFVNVDLSTVQNLESCYHGGPNFLDLNTLLSSSRLPKSFLRGSGLPDSLINYSPSLLNEPVQVYSCFISYSSKDEEFAERLHADLQTHGVRCWFAPEDKKIGDRIRPVIDESIRVYDKLLLILSEESIKSAWVEKEVETAFEKEQR